MNRIATSMPPRAFSGGFIARGVVAALLFLSLCASAAAAPARADGLQQEMQRLASPFGDSVGAYVLDLRSGRSASLNPDVGFPMASTVKVPVAVHILSLVDEGKLDLHQQVLLKEGDIYPETGGPLDTHMTPGSAITVRDLLHMMLTVSDNNATDILIRLGGGAQAVDARMHALGVRGIRVDRYIWEMLANFYGDQDASAQAPLALADYARLASTDRSEADYRRDKQAYNDDPRDTSTPAGMASLLKLVWDGKALKPETTAVLKSIMLDCRTGQARLKGMLPNGTLVAHKTGSVDDVANDVGVITLPADKGDIVVAVFVKSDRDDAAKDKMIAQLARAAHDYFLFVGGR
ncbi:MAG: class A beta-lactamase [Pseudoxanthomonas sp.]